MLLHRQQKQREDTVVSQELLEILRCPSCVRNGADSGLLDHVDDWLICRDCDRKYPIRDDVPNMLIEEGDRFRNVPRQRLPQIPPSSAKQGTLPANGES